MKYKVIKEDYSHFFRVGTIVTREGSVNIFGNYRYVNQNGLLEQYLRDDCVEPVPDKRYLLKELYVIARPSLFKNKSSALEYMLENNDKYFNIKEIE